MTSAEVNQVVEAVLQEIASRSQGVGGVRKVDNLDNIFSLPALLLAGSTEEVVEAPISLLSRPAVEAALEAGDASQTAYSSALGASAARAEAKAAAFEATESYRQYCIVYNQVIKAIADTITTLGISEEKGKLLSQIISQAAITLSENQERISVLDFLTRSVMDNVSDTITVSTQIRELLTIVSEKIETFERLESAETSITAAVIASQATKENIRNLVSELSSLIEDSSTSSVDIKKYLSELKSHLSQIESARTLAVENEAIARSIDFRNSEKFSRISELISEFEKLYADILKGLHSSMLASFVAKQIPIIRDGMWNIYNSQTGQYQPVASAIGRSPYVKNGNWWVFNDTSAEFIDSGVSVSSDYILTKGNVESVLTGDIVTHNHTSQLVQVLAGHDQSITSHNDIRELLKTRIDLPVYDEATYKLTFATSQGATMEIDLPLEQMGLTYDAQTKTMSFVNAAGEIQRIPLTDFVDIYIGSIGDHIQVKVESGNKISATLLDGSIGIEKLSAELNLRIQNAISDAPADGKQYARIDSSWQPIIADETRLGEIRTLDFLDLINIPQPFGEKYLYCDGSVIDPIDYPDVKLPTAISEWVKESSRIGDTPPIIINGYYILLEYDGFVRSLDGNTWEVIKMASGTNNTCYDVVYNNGLWVAILRTGLYTSMDGLNFTSIPGILEKDTYISSASLAYGGEKWIVFLSKGSGLKRLLTSDDGVNWAFQPVYFDAAYKPIYLNDRWFMVAKKQVSNGYIIFVSLDGLKWTEAIKLTSHYYILDTVEAYGKIFLFVHNNISGGQLYLLEDGINIIDTGMNMSNIKFINGVMYGLNSNHVNISTDGVNWKRIDFNIAINTAKAVFADNLWVSCYNKFVYTSDDAINWTSTTLASDVDCLVHINGTWILASKFHSDYRSTTIGLRLPKIQNGYIKVLK